jgi:AAA15 family ATPase/GTPase
MLVEFSVSNFRSIRDKQTLSMVKGKGSELETTHTFKPAAPSSETLLKSAAIYGANAAGKSNIIKALSMMKQIVVQPPNVGEQLPVVPFMFDPETPQQPTEFELVFITDNVRYQYGFSATAERIWSEWLFAFPKGRSQRWFEREYSPQTGEYTWHLDTNLKGEKKVWRDSTRDNALFLSTAAQLNSESLSPIYTYISRMREIRNDIKSGLISAVYLADKVLKNLIISTLTDADVGILNISTEKNPDEILKDQSPGSDVNISREIHGSTYISKLENESDGTKELFHLAAYLKWALFEGLLLIIDEINAKLHPALVRYLIGLFNSVEHNPKNAQLVFTTHETSILDQDILRRDQVWFCEKDENQATRLYSLLDFKPRKGHENLEAAYLSGRYGAIPMINAR